MTVRQLQIGSQVQVRNIFLISSTLEWTQLSQREEGWDQTWERLNSWWPVIEGEPGENRSTGGYNVKMNTSTQFSLIMKRPLQKKCSEMIPNRRNKSVKVSLLLRLWTSHHNIAEFVDKKTLDAESSQGVKWWLCKQSMCRRRRGIRMGAGLNINSFYNFKSGQQMWF